MRFIKLEGIYRKELYVNVDNIIGFYKYRNGFHMKLVGNEDGTEITEESYKKLLKLAGDD